MTDFDDIIDGTAGKQRKFDDAVEDCTHEKPRFQKGGIVGREIAIHDEMFIIGEVKDFDYAHLERLMVKGLGIPRGLLKPPSIGSPFDPYGFGANKHTPKNYRLGGRDWGKKVLEENETCPCGNASCPALKFKRKKLEQENGTQ